MAINFPPTPQQGDIYTDAGFNWQFNGASWNKLADPVTSSDIQYTPAGTGAVAKDVETKLRETVSVTDFGTVGDGSADDTTAIQNAIGYAESITDQTDVGGVQFGRTYVAVDLAGGRYRITDTLVISKPIIFQNGTLIATTAMTGSWLQGPTFMLAADAQADQCVIQNINLDGGFENTTDNTTATECLNDLLYSRGFNTTIENVNAHHYKNIAIKTDNGASQIIRNCNIQKWDNSDTIGFGDNQWWTGVGIELNTNDNIVNNCILRNNGIGVQIKSSACQVSNSVIRTTSPPTFTSANPILGVELGNVANCNINGCNFRGCAVKLSGPTNHRNSITNNIFDSYNESLSNGTILIETSNTNETLDGLIIASNIFGTNFTTAVGFLTTGSGSYVDDIDLGMHWVSNITDGGGDMWYDAKFGAGVQVSDGDITCDSINGKSVSAYTGGESVTFPNGLIMKMGSISISDGGSTDVIFASAFPNAVVSVTATPQLDNINRQTVHVRTASKTVVRFHAPSTNTSTITAYWQAFGY